MPQFIDDEGTYSAQAYAVERLGELTHYTYWYDHPPLGWLQMAGWTSLTNAFDRYPSAVMAGRETMMVALAASTLLLWVLVRRIGAPASSPPRPSCCSRSARSRCSSTARSTWTTSRCRGSCWRSCWPR
ncbi:hypothetical protein [Litorihabitans aurantiacus]|uniref:Glycosyltransferase RgtA/B/C/D-like domain-containing protein n=1 Tax=Litorihabitans aurantiacus TaxID=1930061 RepID=A0AA37XG10_9MICO|nr:hypothetical protein [Litorihabitans aurantiacus]GMA32332.1 hypothetical protein GCM10025875_23240 [Litorihabitans aurantiacus]